MIWEVGYSPSRSAIELELIVRESEDVGVISGCNIRG